MADNLVFLLQESHEHKQGSLARYSPWGCRVRHDVVTEQHQAWGEQMKDQMPTPIMRGLSLQMREGN